MREKAAEFEAKRLVTLKHDVKPAALQVSTRGFVDGPAEESGICRLGGPDRQHSKAILIAAPSRSLRACRRRDDHPACETRRKPAEVRLPLFRRQGARQAQATSPLRDLSSREEP